MSAGATDSAARVLCLAGPTASGKSALALHIARHLRTRGLRAEIISVDSALVYRGMDIGTAKPAAADRAEFAHHLLDLIEPTQAYSAAAFVRDARACVADIARRGGVALLVGGTMLYFKALFDGLDALPPADPDLRRQIDEEAARVGWPALHAELARVDPVTAARLPPNDAQRIQRALEVYRSTGQALSALHGAWREARQADGGTASEMPAHAPVQWPLLSLEPQSRAWLHERIAHRFDDMLAAGLVAEVQALRRRGDLSPALPSMRCVGYRQVWEFLDQGLHDGGPQRPDPALQPEAHAAWLAMRERGIAATRQLAKRQLTWLRGMPQRQVLACDDPGMAQAALDWVDSLPWLN